MTAGDDKQKMQQRHSGISADSISEKPDATYSLHSVYLAKAYNGIVTDHENPGRD